MFLYDLIALLSEIYFMFFATGLLAIAVLMKNNGTLKETLGGITSLSVLGIFFSATLQYNKINMDISISNFLVNDLLFTNVIKILSILFILALFFVSRSYFNSCITMPFETPILTLFSIMGIFVIFSTNDLVLLYLGLELQSLSIYALVSAKYNSNVSTEAGIKYFILGSFISGFILYAISLIYLITGTTNIKYIQLYLLSNDISITLILSLILLLSGLLFKLSAAPFHNWTPDVFEGSPTIVTLFIATLPKLAVLTVIINLFFVTFYQLSLFSNVIFIISGILSLLIGTFGALYQTKIKRLLAYSTINNMGYILLLLGTGTKASIEISLFYLTIYMLINLGIFSIIITYIKNKNRQELIFINDLNVLYKINPVLSNIFMLNIFSLIGIPPLAGFFSKFYLLEGLLSNSFIIPAIIVVLVSTISTFYYIRLIKIIYYIPNFWTGLFYKITPSITFVIYFIFLFNILIILNIDYLVKIYHLIVLNIYI